MPQMTDLTKPLIQTEALLQDISTLSTQNQTIGCEAKALPHFLDDLQTTRYSGSLYLSKSSNTVEQSEGADW